MIGVTRALLLKSISLISLALIACGGESGDPSGPGIKSEVLVTGYVIEIENMMPVDGGITIKVELESKDTERLWFGSLFTVPPPSEDKLKLYDVVRRVELGDRVRATGERTEAGIELEGIAILEGRP